VRSWIVIALASLAVVVAPAATAGSALDRAMTQCVRPADVQRLVFSAVGYANIRRLFRRAVRRGWPRRLVLNRPGPRSDATGC
jgi:hypothetical protein